MITLEVTQEAITAKITKLVGDNPTKEAEIQFWSELIEQIVEDSGKDFMEDILVNFIITSAKKAVEMGNKEVKHNE